MIFFLDSIYKHYHCDVCLGSVFSQRKKTLKFNNLTLPRCLSAPGLRGSGLIASMPSISLVGVNVCFTQKKSLDFFFFPLYLTSKRDFPCGSVVKNLPASARDTGLRPGSGRSPGIGSGNPLWYCCLGDPMDRGAWWAAVHGVAKSRT